MKKISDFDFEFRDFVSEQSNNKNMEDKLSDPYFLINFPSRIRIFFFI